LETTVTSLLLVTAAVVLACVVVNYAVNIVEQVANTDNIPQLDGIKNIENNLLNQTGQLFNETQPQLPSQPPP
jgi:predicted PurR-regulated permease PerM